MLIQKQPFSFRLFQNRFKRKRRRQREREIEKSKGILSKATLNVNKLTNIFTSVIVKMPLKTKSLYFLNESKWCFHSPQFIAKFFWFQFRKRFAQWNNETIRAHNTQTHDKSQPKINQKGIDSWVCASAYFGLLVFVAQKSFEWKSNL